MREEDPVLKNSQLTGQVLLEVPKQEGERKMVSLKGRKGSWGGLGETGSPLLKFPEPIMLLKLAVTLQRPYRLSDGATTLLP